MAGEMFGTSVGFQNYQEDQIRQANSDALVRVHNANAAEAESKAAQTQAMQSALAGVGGGESTGDALTDTTNLLARQSAALAKAGLPLQAGKVATEAAGLQLKKQQGMTAAALESYRAAQAKQITYSELNGLLSGVTDKGSFDNAKMIYMSRHPELKEIPKELQTYNPALVDHLLNTTREGMRQLELELKQQDFESRDEARKDESRFRDARRVYLDGMLEARKERLKQTAKATGSKINDPGVPTKSETETARDLINKNFTNLPPEEARLAAFEIAARAKQLRKGNTALDAGAALNMALEESKKAGNFPTLDETFLGFKTGSKTKYKPATTPKPLPLPPRGTPLQIGQTYQTSKGVVKWTGQNAVPVEADSPDDDEEE